MSSTAQKTDDDVNEALRLIGESIVDDFCEKAVIIADYRRTATITPEIFEQTCRHIGLKANHYAAPEREDGRFPKCEKFKHERRAAGRGSTPRPRGKKAEKGIDREPTKAEKEMDHEAKNLQCLYVCTVSPRLS